MIALPAIAPLDDSLPPRDGRPKPERWPWPAGVLGRLAALERKLNVALVLLVLVLAVGVALLLR